MEPEYYKREKPVRNPGFLVGVTCKRQPIDGCQHYVYRVGGIYCQRHEKESLTKLQLFGVPDTTN